MQWEDEGGSPPQRHPPSNRRERVKKFSHSRRVNQNINVNRIVCSAQTLMRQRRSLDEEHSNTVLSRGPIHDRMEKRD
jgi:hypothetical protein